MDLTDVFFQVITGAGVRCKNGPDPNLEPGRVIIFVCKLTFFILFPLSGCLPFFRRQGRPEIYD